LVFPAENSDVPELMGRYQTWEEAEAGHQAMVRRCAGVASHPGAAVALSSALGRHD
jgi:hypothetical protein